MELTRGRVLSTKIYDHEMQKDNVYMFVPNLIGYVRIALLFVAFGYAQENYVVAVSCYILSAALDEFDGFFARYLGQTSVYGQQLDEITDELATMGIAVVCCYLYPEYMWFFQLLTAVDIAGHWAHMHNSVLEGNTHHKSGQKNPILRIYWTNKVLNPMWVYLNHVFLAMTYLCYFSQGPVVSLLGYSIGVFKLIAYIAAPWSISRGIINGLMMIEAFKNFARLDVEKRIAQREQQNRHGVQNGNATSIKNGEVARGDNHAHQN